MALILQTQQIGAQSSHVRGPPTAETKSVKKVATIGENLRLVCPVSAYPAPMVEWSKNGEIIDFMWERHRTGKKWLKIKNLSEDDTGIFTCKAINGFGSETVRIELIVVDPAHNYDLDTAPPVFTHATRMSDLYHTKSVGDTFTVSCEALGSPQPEIFWFKDGQHIDESVSFKNGKSTVEFSVLGTADSGVYTCRASNMVGEQTMNYTLEVTQTVGTTHAIVTEAGPVNGTVEEGGVAQLHCRVKSLAPPHIKWLKRLEDHEAGAANTLTVGHERYRILESNSDVPTGNDEYLNKLTLVNVHREDAGMYICFVTNSGFGPLTYKSMTLRVVERTVAPGSNNNNDVSQKSNYPVDSEPKSILIVVICLSLVVFVLLLLIVICVIRKRSLSPEGQNKNRPEIAILDAESPDLSLRQPFMKPALGSEVGKYPGQVHPLSGRQSHSSSQGYWSHGRRQQQVYPDCYTQRSLKIGGGADSGVFTASSDQHSPKDTTSVATTSHNQYEVPFSHLLQPSAYQIQRQQQQQRLRLGGDNPYVFSSGSSGYSDRRYQQQVTVPPPYPSRNVSEESYHTRVGQSSQGPQQYFADYDSQS